MGGREHWNTIYRKKTDDQVSWFETLPEISLKMLDAAGLNRDSCVVDVGGGDSRLVDALTAKGLDCLAVLDVSSTALNRAKTRLGSSATAVTMDRSGRGRGLVAETRWTSGTTVLCSTF